MHSDNKSSGWLRCWREMNPWCVVLYSENHNYPTGKTFVYINILPCIILRAAEFIMHYTVLIPDKYNAIFSQWAIVDTQATLCGLPNYTNIFRVFKDCLASFLRTVYSDNDDRVYTQLFVFRKRWKLYHHGNFS